MKKLTFLMLVIAATLVVMTPAVDAGKKAEGPVDLYGQTVRKDNEVQAKLFSQFGTEDLSGLGLDACVINPDCMSGNICVAGTKPNTPQMPGYCVPESTP